MDNHPDNDCPACPLSATAKGNPYSDLFSVIQDRISNYVVAMFTQMGVYSLSMAERDVVLTQRVRCRGCAAAVFEGEQQQIWPLRLASSNPTSCAQVSSAILKPSSFSGRISGPAGGPPTRASQPLLEALRLLLCSDRRCTQAGCTIQHSPSQPQVPSRRRVQGIHEIQGWQVLPSLWLSCTRGRKGRRSCCRRNSRGRSGSSSSSSRGGGCAGCRCCQHTSLQS
jgi:hypothetical protein